MLFWRFPKVHSTQNAYFAFGVIRNFPDWSHSDSATVSTELVCFVGWNVQSFVLDGKVMTCVIVKLTLCEMWLCAVSPADSIRLWKTVCVHKVLLHMSLNCHVNPQDVKTSCEEETNGACVSDWIDYESLEM